MLETLQKIAWKLFYNFFKTLIHTFNCENDQNSVISEFLTIINSMDKRKKSLILKNPYTNSIFMIKMNLWKYFIFKSNLNLN